MSGSESSQGLTWSAKLTLVGAVAAAAALYLSGLYRHHLPVDTVATPVPASTEEQSGARAARTEGVEYAPIEVAPRAATARSSPPSAEAFTPVPAAVVAPPFVTIQQQAADRPARKKSATFQGTEAGEPLSIGRPTAPSPGPKLPPTLPPAVQARRPIPEAASQPVQPRIAESRGVPAPGKPMHQVPTAVAAAASEKAAGHKTVDEQESAPSHEVSHAEARAFAKAVLSEPEASPKEAIDKAEAQTSARAEGAREAPADAKNTPAPARGTLTERQARILAEYEAMRRAAEEELRQRWPGPRMLRPMSPFGAYPYAPEYYYYRPGR